jgi:hypothetical protein
VTSGEDLIDANAVADDVNQYCKPAIHDALEEFNATWRDNANSTPTTWVTQATRLLRG